MILLQITISPESFLEFLLGPFGTLVLSLFILYAGYKGWWVFGWYATELRKRNERLENRIDNISGTAKSIASVAEKSVAKAERQLEATSE